LLDRQYTIPILFGICLGIIMAGVQISATALDAATGSKQRTAILLFEGSYPDRVDMRLLGKQVSLPSPGLLEADKVPAAVRAHTTVIIEEVGREAQRCRQMLESLLQEVTGPG